MVYCVLHIISFRMVFALVGRGIGCVLPYRYVVHANIILVSCLQDGCEVAERVQLSAQ
jgi:hypothetical protein